MKKQDTVRVLFDPVTPIVLKLRIYTDTLARTKSICSYLASKPWVLSLDVPSDVEIEMEFARNVNSHTGAWIGKEIKRLFNEKIPIIM